MIGRLLKITGTLIVCFSVGTLIAEAIMLRYVWTTWEMDWDKGRQMLAIAQGHDLVALREQAAVDNDAVSGEQPSLEQIADARAMKSRNLELREQALAQDLQQLRLERRKLTEEVGRFQTSQEQFETRLASMTSSEKQTGFDQNIAILQNMKPKQAKEIFMRMYDNKEIDDVVRLMAGMAPSKRKKISNEFKTAEENEKLGEILRRIREGYPLVAAVDAAQEDLRQPVANSR